MEPEILCFYTHRGTGSTYRVLAVARVEATLEPVVVYQACDARTWWLRQPVEDNTWTRPVAEFCDGRFVVADPLDKLIEHETKGAKS